MSNLEFAIQSVIEVKAIGCIETKKAIEQAKSDVIQEFKRDSKKINRLPKSIVFRFNYIGMVLDKAFPEG